MIAIDLIHDGRHVCFPVIMQIRQVISEGVDKLKGGQVQTIFDIYIRLTVPDI